MNQNSRKREVRLSTKDIKKRTKSAEKVELRFIGTSRCGLNAIGRWMIEHYKGYGFYQSKTLKTLSDNKKWYAKLLNGIVQSKKNLVCRNNGDRLCVGFNWKYTPWELCLKTPSVYKNRVNVMILRDPANQLASIEQSLSLFDRNLTAREYIEWREVWMHQAQAFVNAKLWDGKTFRILYNRWVVDSEYRKKILDTLGENFSSEDLDITKRYGKSPFKSNKVLKRDREMRDSHPVQAIQRDEQLKSLSQKIFG